LNNTKCKILIVKFRNIGDVFLSTALFEALKDLSENNSISYAVNSFCYDVLSENPRLDNIHLYNREKIKNQSLLHRVYYEISYIFKIRKCKYDVVLNLTEGDRGMMIGLLSGANKFFSYHSKKKIYSLFPKIKFNNVDKYEHTVRKDLSFLKFFTKDSESDNYFPRIYYSEIDKEKITQIISEHKLDRFAIVHPVSRWFFKCWNDEKVVQIINYLYAKYNLQIVLTSSPDVIELYKCKSIEKLIPHAVVNLSGELTLGQICVLMKKSTLCFCIDSAPMHIAASLRIPLVAIFGASYPSIWAPWSGKKTCYQNSNGIQQIDNNVIIVDMDHNTYYKNLDKVSIGMENISVTQVKKAIDKVL